MSVAKILLMMYDFYPGGTGDSSNEHWWRFLWGNRDRICSEEGSQGDSNILSSFSQKYSILTGL